MVSNGLYDGDVARISEHIGCSKKLVDQIKYGQRGKRNTKLQQAIKEAMNYRAEQNKAFEVYCNQLKSTAISLK